MTGPDPYPGNDEHLADELHRVDQLVRAEVARRGDGPATRQVEVGDGEGEAAYVSAARGLAVRIGERVAVTPDEVDLRLPRLAALAGLTVLDRDVLLAHLLPEHDDRNRRLYRELRDEPHGTGTPVELVARILGPAIEGTDLARLRAVRAAYHPSAALRSRRLLVAAEDAGEIGLFAQRRYRIDDRVAAFLAGDDTLDGAIRGLVTEPPPGPVLADLVLEEPIAAQVRAVLDGPEPVVLLLHGPPGSGRRTLAGVLARHRGVPLLVADTAAVFAHPAGWEQAVDRCHREARLREAVLCWADCTPLLEPDRETEWAYLTAGAEAAAGTTVFTAEAPWDPVDRFRRTPFLRLDLPIPGHRARARLWARQLAQPDDLADALAEGFQFTPGQIGDAVAAARALARLREPGGRPAPGDLYEGARRQTARRLIAFARRVKLRTELTFDDLIVPAPSRRQLDELRWRIGHRGQVHGGLGFERRLPLGSGLVALFTGASGTGKTMAAELLAREHGVDLYKVDLAAVLSKWVGETEKNLGRMFHDAERANVILFFDEADALFGRRGEVKEAQDRWANLEVDYLLQRIEEYSGVVVLASNLRQNIDEAFVRRFHLIVDFPFPEPDGLARILRGMFPPGVDRPADADLRAFADRFRLAGGIAKNAVVDAAFRALAETPGGRPSITLRHLGCAVAREYQKLGRPITQREFGAELYTVLVDEEII